MKDKRVKFTYYLLIGVYELEVCDRLSISILAVFLPKRFKFDSLAKKVETYLRGLNTVEQESDTPEQKERAEEARECEKSEIGSGEQVMIFALSLLMQSGLYRLGSLLPQNYPEIEPLRVESSEEPNKAVAILSVFLVLSGIVILFRTFT